MKLKTRLFIALVTIGVVLTFLGIRDWMCLSKPVKDITNLWDYDYSNLKAGDHICLDVTLVWDQIGSQIEQSKTYGVTTSERETGRYYVIPFCQDEDKDYIYPTPFLLAKIPSSFNSAMDSQISKSDDWWATDEDFTTIPTSTMHFDGKLVKIPNDLRKEIESKVYPGEDLEDYMLPVMFEPIMAPGAVKGMTIAGIICLLITGGILFVMFRNKSGDQTALYGAPKATNAGFVPQSGNAGSTGFGAPQAQNGIVNNVDPYAGGQPQNTQSNFGGSFGGPQPQNAQMNFASAFGTPQQNAQGSFGMPMGGQPIQNAGGNMGTAFGGQQPQNMQGGFGTPMGGQPTQNAAGNMGAAFGSPQQQNVQGGFGSAIANPQTQGAALGGFAAATQSVQPLGPTQSLGSQPTGPSVSTGSFPGTGIGSHAPAQEPASIFGSEPKQEPVSIFGNEPKQEPASILGNEPKQEPVSILGNEPKQEPASIFGNAPKQEPASILGNTPGQNPAVPIGNAPTQNAGSTDGDITVRNIFGEIDVEATEKARKEKEEAEKARKEEEARAELLKAMAYASSHPAVLPLGGGAAAVQQSSQAATLPLGVSPTEVSSGPASNAPATQTENVPDNSVTTQQSTPSSIGGSGAPTQQNNNPLYANTPAQQPVQSPVGGNSAPTQQNNNPLYASTPAQQPAPSPVSGNSVTQQNNNPLYGGTPAQPEKPENGNENAPLYADNTEMKKVFSGAFGNNNT